MDDLDSFVYIVMAVDHDDNVRVYGVYLDEEDAKDVSEKLRGCWYNKWKIQI